MLATLNNRSFFSPVTIFFHHFIKFKFQVHVANQLGLIVEWHSGSESLPTAGHLKKNDLSTSLFCQSMMIATQS
jgi:hypothetical protein